MLIYITISKTLNSIESESEGSQIETNIQDKQPAGLSIKTLRAVFYQSRGLINSMKSRGHLLFFKKEDSKTEGLNT